MWEPLLFSFLFSFFFLYTSAAHLVHRVRTVQCTALSLQAHSANRGVLHMCRFSSSILNIHSLTHPGHIRSMNPGWRAAAASAAAAAAASAGHLGQLAV